MAESMPGRVLDEWMEFYRIEPFGGWRNDAQSAIVAATVAGVFAGKGARKPRIEDYILQELLDKMSAQKQSDAERVKRAIGIAMSMGWKVKELGKHD